jgi:hypothetical protein
MEARKTRLRVSLGAKGRAKLPIGRISRKGLNYFGQSKSKRVGLSPILSRIAKIGKNHFLPHSITSTYKEIKCILKSWFMPYLFLKKEFGNHHPPLMFYCFLIIAYGG